MGQFYRVTEKSGWTCSGGSVSVTFHNSALAASQKTRVEEEVLIYPITSLIAEFGGALGLFLGFSFMTIWHKIIGYVCKR